MLKLLIGVVICLFLLSYGCVRAEVFQNTWPMPLTTGDFITLEAGTNLMEYHFTAKTDFSVEWYEWGGKCIQKQHGGYAKLMAYSQGIDEGTGGLMSSRQRIINSENLDIFYNAGTCSVSEHYEAGEDYVGYFIPDHFTMTASTTGTFIENNFVFDYDWGYDDNYPIELRQESNENYYYSNPDLWLGQIPMLDIFLPESGAKILSNFQLKFNYSNAENWDRLLIVFEDWNASSTCPAQYSDTYYDEKELGWFNNQSLPSFSDFFDNATGTMSMDISGLEVGNYNCIRCVFINESEGKMSGELCPAFEVEVVEHLPPEESPDFFLPIGSWEDYYNTHSERYDEPTAVFTTLATAIEPLISWVGNTVIYFNENFNSETAKERGQQLGQAIPKARGYLETLNSYFGDLPISELFIFFLITLVAVLIFRLVRIVLTIIVP